MPRESTACEVIDRALVASGWLVQDLAAINLYAGPGVAVREVQLASGHGVADTCSTPTAERWAWAMPRGSTRPRPASKPRARGTGPACRQASRPR